MAVVQLQVECFTVRYLMLVEPTRTSMSEYTLREMVRYAYIHLAFELITLLLQVLPPSHLYYLIEFLTPLPVPPLQLAVHLLLSVGERMECQ